MSTIKYNQNKRVRFALVITLLVGVALLLSPFKVMADIDAKPTLTFTSKSVDVSKISLYVSDVNSYVGFNFMEYVKATGTVDATYNLSLDMTTYRNKNQSEKSKIMQYALDSLKDTSISNIAKNKIYNFIESQDESTASLVRQLSNDVTADFAEAYYVFKPFSGWLGLLLGIVSIVIFVTLTLMILADLSFITIPLVRDWLTPAKSGDKPKFVSNEAWDAVKEVDSESNKHKNVLSVYLKMKVSQFVILSICILYLLSGQIYILIGNLMDMFRGILG